MKPRWTGARYRTRTCLAGALAAVGTGAVIAAAHIVAIAWDVGGRFSHTSTVPPGKFFEVCGKFEAGARVKWEFDATAPLDFNIHYHAGKDVVFPAKLSQVSTARDELVAGVTQDFCWMWTNKAQRSADVRVSLSR